jgi:hypothetical protein
MDADTLDRGPGFLRRWANQIAKAINANHQECVARHAFGSATKTDTGGEGGGDSGGSTGDDDVEIVTGAVNGVPSTLNVITDGSGWIGI